MHYIFNISYSEFHKYESKFTCKTQDLAMNYLHAKLKNLLNNI